MENIKVRVLDGVEPKGTAELEQELLEKHQRELENQNPPATPPANDPPKTDPPAKSSEEEEELSEEKVLSFIAKKYNKEINSFDELIADKKASEDLPEDVSTFLKYKKETGRGIQDFLKATRDIDSLDDESLLKDYLKSMNEELDDEDIEILMDDYRYDEDVDDESTINKVKIQRKKAIAEAKKLFKAEQEKYKIPLESRTDFIPETEKEEYKKFKQYIDKAKTIEEENQRKREWFDRKSDEVFSDGFKGFEFVVGDKKITYNPGDKNEVRKNQSTPLNFVSKFLDEQGMIKDPFGYHKALSAAMDPDKLAKFFYELGQSEAIDGTMRNIKNIQMSDRRAPEVAKSADGVQVRAVNPDSGKGLKIRSAKKV